MKEQPKFDLTFPSVDVTEMNRSSCYYKKPISAILFFLLVNLRTTETSKLTNILLIGSFQSPLIHGCLFLCVCLFLLSRLRYLRVTDRLGIQTNMADKYRCQEILAPGNIEDYCESNLTFP